MSIRDSVDIGTLAAMIRMAASKASMSSVVQQIDARSRQRHKGPLGSKLGN